ncbi:MAG: hypothetical protein FWG02_06820 [Holophagaceae bacterium]|nr:hypothetical protein [Holophagaceae bacterium]
MATAVVCAYSLVGRKALEALLDCGIKVVALYTYKQPEEDRWFESPADFAIGHGIPIFFEPNINAPHVLDHIKKLEPDFLFSFYFREMIRPELLSVPKIGAFNLHGSMLPKYRGRAPINWVLVRGETNTGISLHSMTAKPDDGDIFGQTEIPIAWDDTALSLTKKTAEAGYELLREKVPLLSKSELIGIPQKSLGLSSYFGGRKPGDSRLTSQMTAHHAFNQIRAVADPWPNAFIESSLGMIKIAWALPCSGECVAGHFKRSDDGVIFGFSDAPLRLISLKKGTEKSDAPDVFAEWLRAIGVKEC